MKRVILFLAVLVLAFSPAAQASPFQDAPTNTELGVVYGGTGVDTLGELLAAMGALDLAGGTMTGFITLHADPTDDMHAATKQYVDDQIAGTTPSVYDPANVAITGGSISGVTLSLGALAANGVKGNLLTVTAGENLAEFDVVAIRNSSGAAKAFKYSAATADSDKLLLAVGIATAAITSGQTGTILTEGIARNSGWTIAAEDTGKTVYTSATTDGGIALAVPSATGDIIQSLGRVVIGESDTIYFRPSMDYGVKP
jgi:hypothetical protein